LIGGGGTGTSAPMLIFRHYTGVPEAGRGAVIALGNFDGVHRGHQAVIGTARELARQMDSKLGVMTFEPHPRSYFQPDTPPFRLSPFRIKVRHMESFGVDLLYALRFDAKLAALSAEDFVSDILVAGFGVRHVVIGYDFKFGAGRRGDGDFLIQQGEINEFGVSVVQPARDVVDEVYSSSLIRDYLRNGQPQRAAALFGHLWEIEGRVLHGDQRGRTIGFPTANVDLGEYMRPAFGVYAVRAGVPQDGRVVWYDGVANLGLRPTVGGERLLLEVHLFDYAGDLYGQHLRVALVDFLRPERKFTDFSALKAQIDDDARQARQLLLARSIGAGDFVGEDL
jgi:riboflavin kinase / FMN adenylyltransferase